MVALVVALVAISLGAFLWFENTAVVQPSLPITQQASTGTPPALSSSASTASSTPAVSSSPISVVTTTPSAPPIKSNFQFGISTGGGLAYLNQNDLMARLQAIKKLGVGWVRFDVDWSVIQKSNSSSYNWAGYDRIVANLNALGLKGLGIIDYTPQWARPVNCPQSLKCAPADPAQFATFAQTVVKRYSSKGMHTWEIWNEPNITDFWQPTPDVTLYTNLLEDTYTAIKKQDPSAFVLSGGLSRSGTGNNEISPVDFLTQLYADGAEPYFDAVALHPYSYPNPPSYAWQWNPWYQIASTTPSLRSVMIANGDANKKIWLTEYGAPTNGPGILATPESYTVNQNADHVTEVLQAQMMADAIISAEKMPWIGPLFFYTYKDSGTSTSTIENFFGFVRFDGSEKPAYTTIKNLISE